MLLSFFFFQAEDGIRYIGVTGVQTCALPISLRGARHAEVTGEQGLAETVDVRLEVVVRRGRRAEAGGQGVGIAPPGGVQDRKSVVEGKSGDLGGRRIIKKKNLVPKRMPAANL